MFPEWLSVAWGSGEAPSRLKQKPLPDSRCKACCPFLPPSPGGAHELGAQMRAGPRECRPWGLLCARTGAEALASWWKHGALGTKLVST